MSDYSVDEIKNIIDEIYENYGIDTDEMTEEELGRISEYYLRNNNDMVQHLADSRKAREQRLDGEDDE